MTALKQPKQTQFDASMTGVNPARTHGFGAYRGRRVVWSVRVDETLLKQAKTVLTAKFGSHCRGVETWLAGLVAMAKGEQLAGVYPSNTVEIGRLVIERNLRSRRKLVVEDGAVRCAWKGCREVAERIVKYRGRETPTCLKHLKEVYERLKEKKFDAGPEFGVERLPEEPLQEKYSEEVVEEIVERLIVRTCGFCRKSSVGVFRNRDTGVEKQACTYHAKILGPHKKWVKVKTKS